MSRSLVIAHQFVDIIPERLDEGVVYVSIPYATAVHLCCCGCKSEVVTPLSPTDWSVTFDGQSISLDPSIGNWSFDCQSHYWIQHNRIRWARRWHPDEIAIGRERAARAKEIQFGRQEPDAEHEVAVAVHGQDRVHRLCRRLRRLWPRAGRSRHSRNPSE